jgi:hypothetical protein
MEVSNYRPEKLQEAIRSQALYWQKGNDGQHTNE